MIYLDNAATSWPKPSRVYIEMVKCLGEYCANPGRGGHDMSIKSGMAVLDARETISNLFNIENLMRVCFTKNATEALNLAFRGYLKASDHVVTTSMEHNSVIRPLKTMEKHGIIELTVVECNGFGVVNPDDIKKSLKKNTRLVACTLSSNVNGSVMPVKDIGDVCRENGITFLVDASQGAGTISIDVKEINAGMLAFPGHKGLLGPQGTGGLYVEDEIALNTIMQGGTGSNSENVYQPEIMPDALESGTLNTPGIVGLRHGIGFIESIGIKNLELYKSLLLKRLIDGFKELGNLRVYSLDDCKWNSGIAAVNFDGADSNEVSSALNKEFGIATRAGLHCAPLAHKTLGTMETGVVRFSIGCFNTIDEIDFTLEVMRKLSMRYKNI